MRLTLNAAETGHLVLATLHSATVAEALQRIVLAFPPEIQSGIAAQLADALVAVVCQRLRFLPDAGLRVPECEILMASTAARSVIRQSEFSKLASVLETGAGDGSTTFARYRRWVDGRTRWVRPMVPEEGSGLEEIAPEHRRVRPQAAPSVRHAATAAARSVPRSAPATRAAPAESEGPTAPASNAAVFEIDPDSDDLNSVMAELVEKED
jgi:twitching motility protein PilT